MGRKKVCLISTVTYTNELFLLPMAEYFQKNTDWEVTLMCCADDPDYPNRIPEGVRFIHIPMKRGVSLCGFSALLKMRKVFRKEKFDLIQYCTPNASLYASLAGMLAGVPVRLYCQWGMYFVSFPGGIKRWIFKTMEKLTCKVSTHVQPDSFGNLELCHELGLYPKSKGSVVWNGSTCGIDLERFDISRKEEWRQEVRSLWNIPEDAWVFGFMGRINRDKGVNELLEAFRQLVNQYPNAYLLMLGNRENEQYLNKELFDWTQEHPRVILCGYQHEVEKYLASMDCYVLPSYREGFGTTVIEAEAMELPVVATDIQGPRESMSNGVTGILVKPRDAEALREGMEWMLQNPETGVRYGKAGRPYVAQRFELQRFLYETTQDRKRLLEQK